MRPCGWEEEVDEEVDKEVDEEVDEEVEDDDDGTVDNQHLRHPAIGKPWQTGESLIAYTVVTLTLTVETDKQTKWQIGTQPLASPGSMEPWIRDKREFSL